MPLYVGEQRIAKCYVGSTEIARAYKGDALVFANAGILTPGTIVPNTNDLSAYTMSDVPAGAAGIKRGFGVAFAAHQNGAFGFTGVTFNSVAADYVAHELYASTMLVGVAWSLMPTGSDVDVVVSLTASANRFVARPFTTYLYEPDASFEDGEAQNLSVSAAVKPGGAVIAVGAESINAGTLTMGGLSELDGSNNWENENNQYRFGSEGPMDSQTKNITLTGSAAPSGSRAGLLALTFKPW